MEKLNTFLSSLNVDYTREWVHKNPIMGQWAQNYKFTLKRKGFTSGVSFYFSGGAMATCEISDLIYCLITDMQYLDESQETFIDEFGYSEREGRKIYNAIIKNTERLHKLFTNGELVKLSAIVSEE